MTFLCDKSLKVYSIDVSLKKKLLFCLLFKKNDIPLRPLNKNMKEMRIANLNNLSILHIIRVVVVTSRGEKGCMY